MTYDELKRAVVASSAYLTPDMERRDEAVAFQLRTDGNETDLGLDSNQCAYCLQRNHRWRECRSYLNGKSPAKRPPGMSPARAFPPPPQNGRSNGRRDRPRAFMTMNAVVEDERAVALCTSTSSDAEISILCDSCANVHMTLWKQDLIETRTVDRSCTFGNKGQLQALEMGEIPLLVSVRGKEAPVEVTLEDVLWVPGLPCRLLSTGSIRRDGGEFVDSGTKESDLRFRQDGPKIPLAENKGFLTLSASLQGLSLIHI